jgi:hypothetical protein
MSEPLSPEDSRLLLDLCRAGKLYEIEKWIAGGKSTWTSVQIKKTPLQVAMDAGFHSLVELLIRNEERVESKNKALAEAVERKRIDLVMLLVSYGAEIQSVPLSDVLLTWEPRIIGFFLDHGADVVTGAPFAYAFCERVRTALRPYIEYKNAHPEVVLALQEQADRALRHFCHEGDLKWISLLLWAGANARSRGPDMDERWADDPDCHTTALNEACSKGNLAVLKKLKPDPRSDDLAELLSNAALTASKEITEYLLSLGAKVNNKPNGGSSALDRCLWHLGFGSVGSFLNKRLSTKYDVSGTFDCIQLLIEHGALWTPDDRSDLNSIRQALYKCEPAVVVDLVKLLARNKACPEETLERLLDVPRMREHLSTLGMRLIATAPKRLHGRR